MIPAFNEDRSIGLLIKDIRNRYPNYDILVINDASSDKTFEIASQAGAIVITHPFNLGIGATVQTGYQYAHKNGYDIAVQMDGDAQHDPISLSDLLEPVIKGRLDLTIGSRFLTKKSSFRSTFTRRIGIRFFSVLLSTFTGIPLSDPTSGYRATGKKLIPKFAHYYPSDFPEPEAIQMARRFNARVGEVPVKMRKRLGGVSSIRNLTALYYMIKVTIAILLDTLKTKEK